MVRHNAICQQFERLTLLNPFDCFKKNFGISLLQKEFVAFFCYDSKEICPAINLVSDVIWHALSLTEFVGRNPLT